MYCDVWRYQSIVFDTTSLIEMCGAGGVSFSCSFVPTKFWVLAVYKLNLSEHFSYTLYLLKQVIWSQGVLNSAYELNECTRNF